MAFFCNVGVRFFFFFFFFCLCNDLAKNPSPHSVVQERSEVQPIILVSSIHPTPPEDSRSPRPRWFSFLPIGTIPFEELIAESRPVLYLVESFFFPPVLGPSFTTEKEQAFLSHEPCRKDQKATETVTAIKSTWYLGCVGEMGPWSSCSSNQMETRPSLTRGAAARRPPAYVVGLFQQRLLSLFSFAYPFLFPYFSLPISQRGKVHFPDALLLFNSTKNASLTSPCHTYAGRGAWARQMTWLILEIDVHQNAIAPFQP